MNLEDSLKRIKERIEGRMPEENVKIMHDATRQLKESGIADGILKVGDKAPEWSLLNQKGELMESSKLSAEKGYVLTFYRGIWCPYCNKDLSFLSRYTDDLRAQGYEMLAVSPQLQEFSQQVHEQQRLNFDLLHDSGNKLANAFGLRWEMKGDLRSLYNDKFQIILPEYNGDKSWTLPVPARFIVDKGGSIRYAEYSVDYTERPDPDVLLKAVAQLQA